MIRDSQPAPSQDLIGFRLRGTEITRLESFSDAVFGFALTLLVVSLDVPKSFADLVATMRGFPAFALCFLLLALIWNSHDRFCRRYGLNDRTTRFLTCVLLFLVLFYVYPLKFLFNFSITAMLFGGSAQPLSIGRGDLTTLLMIYGLGFAAVYGAMTLLYLHAWRLRDQLDLSELEKFDTRYQLMRLVTLVAFGIIAALLALVMPRSSSLVYLLLFPVLRISRILHRKRRVRFLANTA